MVEESNRGKFAGRDEPAVLAPSAAPAICVLDVRRAGGRAVITGASSGIGRVYAEKLADLGWDLTVVSRDTVRLEALKQSLMGGHGVDVEVITADLSKMADITRVAGQIASDASIDLLINNAGVAKVASVATTEPAELEAMILLNSVAPVLLTRAMLPGMMERERGAIINVSSAGAFVCVPDSATYCASKAMLSSFTEAVAGELAGTNVQVQALCPGMTLTELHERGGFDVSWVSSWMTAEQVVDCSFAGLRMGEVVCVPGLQDPGLVTQMRGAGAAVVGQTIESVVAARYREPVGA